MSGLDHQRAKRHPGDDAIAAREPIRRGLGSHRAFADDGATGGDDLVEKVEVLRRVRIGEPSADDRNRATLGAESATVRLGIDSTGGPRNDSHFGARESGCDPPGLLDAVGCRSACTDDRDGPGIVKNEFPTDPQRRRRIRCRREERRIVRVSNADKPHAEVRHQRLLLVGIRPLESIGEVAIAGLAGLTHATEQLPETAACARVGKSPKRVDARGRTPRTRPAVKRERGAKRPAIEFPGIPWHLFPPPGNLPREFSR